MTHNECEAARHLQNAKDCLMEAARFAREYKPETAAAQPLKQYHIEGYHLEQGAAPGNVLCYNLFIAGLIVARVEISCDKADLYDAKVLCGNVFRNYFGSAQQLIFTGSRRVEEC